MGKAKSVGGEDILQRLPAPLSTWALADTGLNPPHRENKRRNINL
jgi:hypothetical protein